MEINDIAKLYKDKARTPKAVPEVSEKQEFDDSKLVNEESDQHLN